MILFFLLPHTIRAGAQAAATRQVISMTSSHWHTMGDDADVKYVTLEGFPDGIIVLLSE